jgi:hydroxyacylglutathione hydrolase
MAPAVADQVDAELILGTLVRQKGSLVSVLPAAGGARVQIDGVPWELTAARVINCTGPDMQYRRVNSPLLQSLFDQKLIVPGPWEVAGGRGGTGC